jgi:hypothetical protein
MRIWQVQRELGDLEGAATALRAGLAALEPAIAPGDSTPMTAGFLKLQAALVGAELDLGRSDAAEAVLARAHALLEAVDPAALESPAFLDPRYMLRHAEARLCGERGDAQGQLAAAQAGVELLRSLCLARPNDTSWRASLAAEESQLAVHAAALGVPGDWLAAHDRSVSALRALLAQDPARGGFSEALAISLLRRGEAHLAAARGLEAEADCAEALQLALDLIGRENLRAEGYAEEARRGLTAARSLQAGSGP